MASLWGINNEKGVENTSFVNFLDNLERKE